MTGGLGDLPPLRQPTGEQPAVVGDGPASGQLASNDGPGVFDDSWESVAPSALSSHRPAGDPFRDSGSGSRPSRGFDRAAQPAAFAAGDDSTAGFPSWGGSSAGTRSIDDGAKPRASAGERAGGRRPGPERRSALDAPTSHGPSGGGRPATRAAAAQRMQESEIKLAGQQNPVRPQEPNRLVLLLGVILVVAAGAGVAWWLTRGGGDAAEDAIDPTGETAAVDDAANTSTVPAAPAEPAPEPILDVPELSLVGVEPGPLDPNTTYSIDLLGEAPGSMLQVVVDGVAQNEPDALLPDLILPPGRHTLSVNVTNGVEAKTSTPIEIYVLGDAPAAGQLANLASVDIINEGWAEAIRRYDGFEEAGHRNLQLLPITPGYWNIFASGLGADVAAVTSYCEEFGLAMPDECFAKTFDPATYVAPGAPAPAPATDGETTGDDAGSMTDQGGETSSTTTGG